MTSHAASRAKSLVGAAALALKERAAEVDRLNVFPVPDGDTGTNMSLTMDAVIAELATLDDEAGIADTCHTITHGSLMGARGNSGVILSQVLRGMCDVISKSDNVDAAVVSEALARARAVAYQAVRKPVEGTMLTVVKDCAKSAAESAAAGLSLEALLGHVLDVAYESVAHGPELLPVLKENGVVDAGAYGLAILAEGLVASAAGTELTRAAAFAETTATMSVEPVDDWQDDEYLYCTEFLLHGASLDRDAVHSTIVEHGGSELVVGEADLLKIHVHTDDPSAVLAYATSLGEVSEVHINNMRRQTAERTDALREDLTDPKPLGAVAVAVGSGVEAILRSLGVDEIVAGGQTMNPSTRDLLEACQRVNAETVLLLPDNSNIVLAASQVPEHCARRVIVVPTTSVPQAFAAMLEFDADGDPDQIAEAMTEAAGRVRTGEVTTAVKDATAKVGAIRAGQVIGIAEREIEVVGDDVIEVAVDLALLLAANGSESLTLIAGKDLDAASLAKVAEAIGQRRPDLEIDSQRGEQPLYPLIMSVE